MKAYKHLVKHALAQGCTISVDDGGDELALVLSTSYKAIIEAIEAVEQAQIMIRDQARKSTGWALIIPFGLEDDETVADHTITPFMDNWAELYEAA